MFFDLLIDLKIPEFYAEILNIFLVSILILFSVIVINFISKKIIINFLEKLSKRSKTDFDNFLIANNIQIYLARLVPVFYIYWIIPFWLDNFQTVLVYALLVLKIYFIFLLVSIIRNFLNATKDFFRTFDSLKGKPIESFVQVAMLFVWFTAVVLIFSIITGTQVSTFLTAMGALSAVIMLIFKDTILGFVASIQLSSNDLIRIGDWVTMKKFGAVHKLPYAWILKYGSIWHRYKTFNKTGKDFLDEVWTDFNYKENWDPATSATTYAYNLTIDGTPRNLV